MLPGLLVCVCGWGVGIAVCVCVLGTCVAAAKDVYTFETDTNRRAAVSWFLFIYALLL